MLNIFDFILLMLFVLFYYYSHITRTIKKQLLRFLYFFLSSFSNSFKILIHQDFLTLSIVFSLCIFYLFNKTFCFTIFIIWYFLVLFEFSQGFCHFLQSFKFFFLHFPMISLLIFFIFKNKNKTIHFIMLLSNILSLHLSVQI